MKLYHKKKETVFMRRFKNNIPKDRSCLSKESVKALLDILHLMFKWSNEMSKPGDDKMAFPESHPKYSIDPLKTPFRITVKCYYRNQVIFKLSSTSTLSAINLFIPSPFASTYYEGGA